MDESLRLAARKVTRVARAKPPRAADGTIETAVVDTASPLRVFLDGGSVSVPAAVVAGVRVTDGARVAVWRRGRKLLVLGAFADTNRPLSGSVLVSLPNGGSSTTQAVSFAVDRFTTTPVVVLTNGGGTGSSNALVQLQSDPTTGGFTVLALHKDVGGVFGSGQSVRVHWLASVAG